MPVLSEETSLESGKLLRKIFKAEVCTRAASSTQMSELSGFVHSKSHVTLQVKSQAQKVNWSYHGMGARSLLLKTASKLIKYYRIQNHKR